VAQADRGRFEENSKGEGLRMSDFLSGFRSVFFYLAAVVVIMAIGAIIEQQNIAKDCEKHGQFKAAGSYFECKPR